MAVILDLCGGTGAWSKPYQTLDGYTVEVVTLPAEDVRHYAARRGWLRHDSVHGVLAAPPCDHFSVSGAQYWRAKDEDGRTDDALSIVDACLYIIRETRPNWWAMENPVGRLRTLRRAALGEPRLIFNPCDYGDAYTKKTLLWGKFELPALNRVTPIRACAQGSWIQRLGGKSAKTKELRAVTPPGFARAFCSANR